MFEQLLELPLFSGVTHEKLAQIVGGAKFHFLKYADGERIISRGEQCAHLTFVISGSVRSTIANTDGRFSVSQTLAAPALLSPDFMFGRFTRYACDVIALGDVSILRVSKNDYVRILCSDQIFLFNYLNILSANAQKAQQGVLSFTTGDIGERIAFWVIALSQPGGTDIVLTCHKHDLSSLFGLQRAPFEEGLRDLQEKGVLDYNDKELVIKDRMALRSMLLRNHNHNIYRCD